MFPIKQDSAEKSLVIVDTDAGTDDAWGLFMAIRAHKDSTVPFKIVAITTTHGNTTVDNVGKNVTRILSIENETGIPIYRGAETAITVPLKLDSPPYHGEDGFGDADLPPIDAAFEADHAVNALVTLSEKYEGQLSVIAMGPLTNLALAIRMKPNIKFKNIYIMGGNIHGEGNVTPAGEFNFTSDAEAACTVLENYTCPIFLGPLETSMTYGSTTKKFRMNELGSIQTPQMELLNKIEANILENTPTDFWSPVDAVVVAWIINAKMVTKTEFHYCTVELHGKHTRGMMVVDKNGVLGVRPNVTFMTEFNTNIFIKMLRWSAGEIINLP